MSSRKFVALVNGILTEIVEVKVTTVQFTLSTGNPIMIVKEKVESVNFANATTSKIFLDSGANYTINGTVPVIKAALDAAG